MTVFSVFKVSTFCVRISIVFQINTGTHEIFCQLKIGMWNVCTNFYSRIFKKEWIFLRKRKNTIWMSERTSREERKWRIWCWQDSYSQFVYEIKQMPGKEFAVVLAICLIFIIKIIQPPYFLSLKNNKVIFRFSWSKLKSWGGVLCNM